MGKPCVSGVEGLDINYDLKEARVGNVVIKEGDIITLDGTNGKFFLGTVPMLDPELPKDLAKLMEWADQKAKIEVWANADTPDMAAKARHHGAKGIGLCRTEAHVQRRRSSAPDAQSDPGGLPSRNGSAGPISSCPCSAMISTSSTSTPWPPCAWPGPKGSPLARWPVRRLLIAALVVAACRTAAPPVIERSPDPTAPPLVGVPLDETQRQNARSAVAAAERNDWIGAERFLAKLPPSHPVTVLAALEVRFLHGEDVAAVARAFAEKMGDYGSAWALATLAATQAGDLEGSVSAARRAAVLQPDPKWDRLVVEGEQALLAAAVREASSLLAAGDAAGALAKARGVLERSPGLMAARLLAVRSALAAGEPRTAAAMVTALGENPEATELKGRVAEALGQWEMAAGLYASLPERHPGRCELLEGARDQLRYRDAPPYLTRAVAAGAITRKGLAAILAWEAPALARRAGGLVPVFEDIVQIAERTDIVTVARAGVIPGDPVARRFYPDRHVPARELRLVLERLAEVLGRPAPRWCNGDVGEGCLALPHEPSGRNAAELVRSVAGREGEPCSHR